MVDFGEAEVFEGEVAEAIDSIVGGEAAAADVIEEFAERLGVHGVAEVRGQSAKANPSPATGRL